MRAGEEGGPTPPAPAPAPPLPEPVVALDVQESRCEEGLLSHPLSVPSPEFLKTASFLGSSLNSVSVSWAGSHLSLCLTVRISLPTV